MKIILSLSFGLTVLLIGLDIRNIADKRILPSALDLGPKTRIEEIAACLTRFLKKHISFMKSEHLLWDEIASNLAFQVRAGKTLVQAIDSISREGSSKAHKKLAKAYTLYETGIPIFQAMERVADDDKDFLMIAGVLEIGAVSGGDAAALLWHVFEVLRRRRVFHGEIKAKLSEAKITSWLLVILPWLIGLFIFRYDSSLLREFVMSVEGRFLMTAAFALWISGMVLVMAALRSVSSYASKER